MPHDPAGLPLLRLIAITVFVGTYVPAGLLLKPLIPSCADATQGWLLLAMASTLAGNLTLVGSVANPIVAEAAREGRVPIGFLEYGRVGVPLTIVTLALGWLVLALSAG